MVEWRVKRRFEQYLCRRHQDKRRFICYSNK